MLHCCPRVTLCILHATVNPYFEPKTHGNQDGLLVKVNEFIIAGSRGGVGGWGGIRNGEKKVWHFCFFCWRLTNL